MTNFHYSLMQKFDAHVKAGGNFTEAHYILREALRRANMKAKQFTDIDDLLLFCLGFKPNANPEAIRAAA